jgi:MFS family permease
MPDRVLTFFEQILILLAIGIVVPVGHALISESVPPWRRTLGRAIVNMIFTLGAWAALAMIPNVPQAGVIGIAALLSTFGKTVFEGVAKSYLRKNGFIESEKKQND